MISKGSLLSGDSRIFLDIDRLYQLLLCGQRKEYGLSSNDTISLALRSSQTLKRVYDFTHQFEAPGVLGDYGFSGKHLNLVKEFYSAHSQESPLGHCWDAHVKHWKDKVTAWHDHEATKSRDAIYWPQGWRAKCTDASEQRCLKAKPNERIECELLYVLSCISNSCIIQYQVGIDFFKIEQNNRGDISQICHQRDSGIKKFFLTAPSKPGLYMIRGKPSYHYSFRQAAETWPKNYDNCSKWLRYFIAWLQVDPQAGPSTPGPMVYFMNADNAPK